MIADISWKSFENFLGFGNEEGAVLFLGMEEGLLDSVSEQGRRPTTYPRTTDLRADWSPDASRFYFWRLPKNQRTWRAMSHLMLRRQGIEHPTEAQLYRYQTDRLGRMEGETLLSELLPKTGGTLQESYLRELLPQRMRVLRDVIGSAGFELVVAYGKDDWSTYKDVLGIRRWRTSGDFEYAQVNGQRLVLAPHLGARTFDRTDQLEHLTRVSLGL